MVEEPQRGQVSGPIWRNKIEGFVWQDYREIFRSGGIP